MTPEDHYQQARKWLTVGVDFLNDGDSIPEDAQNAVAIAQVHATLALYTPKES